jgi:hypothetical protein
MLVGAVQQNLLQPTQQQAADQLQLARDAGLGQVARVELTWARGTRSPSPDTLDRLRAAVAAAAKGGTALYTALYPYGSSQTPLTDQQQADFAAWATAIARAVPGEHHYIIGNEPNLNRFWLPQFGPNGEDVAAPGYVALLAQTYDALKAVSPAIEVLGGTLSHAGIDRPNTRRDTHSPTAFIQDMGTAYRASGRDRPIMDAFTFHPYMLSSDEPPTLTHPDSTTITIADYDKLVQLLSQAFDGTAQKGSTLPIVYDEFGVESIVPPAKESLYTGTEPATIHPIDEATQAAYYQQAMQLAYCQPNVRAFLVFSLIDEPNHAGWQSGVYYADRSPKPSLPTVRAAANHVRRGIIATCPGLEVTPQVRVNWFPEGRPTTEPSRFPVALTCLSDCVFSIRIQRLPQLGTTLATSGRATGRVGERVFFRRTRLAPGPYRFALTARAVVNAGPPLQLTGPNFVVPRR